MSKENTATKKQLGSIPISILDLSTISAGSTPADSFRNTLDLAQHAEAWGFNRYWVAEHHNLPPIASSATSVLISHIAAGTSKIRVGSGGIMLPNHTSLVIAEQFGTLESLYPNRIDLGLGRAPGSDQLTARALRRDRTTEFPEQVNELLAYFDPSKFATKNPVKAIPGEGLKIPVWLLGSSDYSASLAAHLGLPFSFAGHFSPSYTFPAIQEYRENFRPSDILKEPYVMMGMNLTAADTDEKAKWLFSSTEQHFLGLVRGNPVPIQPPADMDTVWNEHEKKAVYQSINGSIVGSLQTVKKQLEKFIENTQVDEIMLTSYIFNHEERLRSYEIISEFIKKA
ncbi:LLM class flavin-dependent oxidoreductase [Metabacillus litoralis]|uniref:LLM class flavin-dependent oxidoreductase n=1 Tax=Metabacillus litoralis TaxID=152268 RepID=UPI00203EBAB3|nr:LLM class flavin-dependent oxidoreductase [Metabacillus litoralis]MCM3653447.1 LLM class flavin-dependent oxidoreductase [Metabacillus litoralis]